MAKRILALCISMLMVMSLFCALPVSAETTLPDNLGTDYTPTDVLIGNLFTDETTTGNSQTDACGDGNKLHQNIKLEGEDAATSADVVTGTWATGGGATMTSQRTVLDPWAVYTDPDADGTYTLDSTQQDYKYPLAGMWLRLNNTAATDMGVYRQYMTPDYTKNVVVRIPVTMTAGSGNAVVNIARSKYENGHPDYWYVGNEASDHEYPIEYNDRNSGVTVAASGRTYLTATFAGNTEATEDPKYSYTLGMVQGTDAGITIRMEEDEFYIGYEYAKDLVINADTTNISSDKPITVDADVLNQVGNKGGLSQEVSWYALNTERTAVVDGITVSASADGKATVSVDSSVAAGEYVLVAVADADADLVKGITVNVENIDLSADYEPGEMPENQLVSLYNAYAQGVSYDEDTGTMSVDGNVGDGVAGATQHAGNGAGVGVKDKNIWTTGTTVVFSANVKKVTGSPKVNFGAWQQSFGALTSKEAPGVTNGIPITSTDWQKVTFTLQKPESGANDAPYFTFGFGFPETPAGETETARSIMIDTSTAYLGIQEAHDIDVTADSTSLFPGKTITVDADVLNQVGSKGTLSQGVTWVAMNSDRTATVDGFTVVEGTDGTATVTVDASVAVGDYYLVAVADADSKLVKGVEVEVISLANDYEAGDAMEGNLITEEAFSTSYSIEAGKKADTGDWYGLYSGSGAPTHSSGVLGGNLPIANLKSAAKSGDHVVFGATVSKVSNADTTVNAVFTAEGVTPSAYSVDYGSAGFDIPTAYSSYQFGATYELDDATTAGSNYHMRLYFGIVNGTTEEGTNEQFIIKNGSMYLGFERAYDLKTTVKGETTITEGTEATLAVDAQVINQVGSTGYLTQGATWVAMNDARTAFVDGITVENADGGAATVTVADTVPAGTYKLIAVADGYANIIKSVNITVGTPSPVYDDIKIEKTAGGITVSTDTALTNAQLIFVTYENGKMVSVNIDTKVNLDAQNAQEYSIPAGYEAAKVMLFTSDFKPLADALN